MTPLWTPAPTVIERPALIRTPDAVQRELYKLGIMAPALAFAHRRPTRSSGGGGGGVSEPSYSAGADSLIFSDTFSSFGSIEGGSNPLIGAGSVYGSNTRFLGLSGGTVASTSVMDLIAGGSPRGGSQCIRMYYGNSAVGGQGKGGLSDGVWGTEGKIDSANQLRAGQPAVGGPYAHFYFTCDIRFSAGADPAGVNESGVKGTMFWHENVLGPGNRYQFSPHRLKDYVGGRYANTRWDFGPPHPPDSTTGLDHYKTSNGEPPPFSDYNDGAWHRLTTEFRTSTSGSTKGCRVWLDGVYMFDNMNNVGGISSVPWGADYTYRDRITHHMWFGNYPNATNANDSPAFYVDLGFWQAWTN